MEALFLKLLNMSIAASWLVLAVMILRLVLKKAPKWVSCILWAMVAIRLICPFFMESVLSLIPSAETVPQDIMYAQEPKIHSGVSILNSTVNPVLSESLAPAVGDSVNPVQIVTYIATILWLVGLVVMVLYAMVSYLRIRRKVAASMLLRDNLYICDYIETPFILGVITPRIYIPTTLEEDKVEYVIAHEKAHLKRHDHWWKPLGFVLLTIYWFHPLIWIAYVLLCRDIELACDERVIKKLGEADKKSYSAALLSCSVSHKMITACPLAFGEVGVKERVRTVLNYQKPAFWVVMVAVAACIVVAICFLTNPKKDVLHPHSDDSLIRWLFRLERADYVACTVETPGESAFYELPWYPEEGQNIPHEELPVNIINTQGTLVFSVNADEDTLTINEEYFEEISGEYHKVKTGNYTLVKNQRGKFSLDVSRRSDEREGYAVYYVPYQGGIYAFKVEFPAGSVQSLLAGSYVSSSCRYMNPLSSTWTFGDSGETYQFVEDALIIIDNVTRNEQRIIPNNWEWQEFPYSDEEWDELFLPNTEEHHISEYYEEMKYLCLSGRYRLLLVDEELWLVTMSENPKMGEYIWSIYTLVHAGSMGSAQWEYQPMLSSQYPAFPIGFAIEDAEIIAYCNKGTLVDFDYDNSEYPQGNSIAIPSSSKLYWSPSTYEGDAPKLAPQTEIGFYIRKDNTIINLGRIYITSDDDNKASNVYTARLVGSDMVMEQNEESAGAIIKLQEASTVHNR